MKHLPTLILTGALLVSVFTARSQETIPEGNNTLNKYSAPAFTGGTTPTTSEAFADYSRNNQVEQATTIESVFPNPATSTAGVMLEAAAVDKVKLYVVNLNGTILSTHQYNGGSQRLNFDVSSLPNGLYSIQVQEEGKSMESIKLFKQN